MKKADLTNTTFMIPVRLESDDRTFNFRFVLNYLINNFDTNIIVFENDVEQKALGIIQELTDFDKVKYMYEDSRGEEMFHRTRFLNMMLKEVKTPVVVNYDTDVFMLPKAYQAAASEIMNGYDLVYPYFQGQSQILVTDEFKEHLSDPIYVLENAKRWTSDCGHCCFFKTESYRNGGMENERFMSYGAEDVERKNRFIKLGYRVGWLSQFIFHIEHWRGANSSAENPYFKQNDELFQKLDWMNMDQTKEYYKSADYIKKYT